uniref:Uncharacterized protein n=1 Tax=Anguilla anguilla TaxID=7936 RepID=A0A0E9TVJ5_ANGAN
MDIVAALTLAKLWCCTLKLSFFNVGIHLLLRPPFEARFTK